MQNLKAKTQSNSTIPFEKIIIQILLLNVN